MAQQAPPSTTSSERPATWEDVIRATAKAQGVPPILALELARQESNFNPAAISPKGARGLMQLMPETAKELGVDPDDPIQNVQGGIRYLKAQLDRYQGDVGKALAAYNAGPGAVDTAGGVPNIPETQQYVQRILGRLAAQPGSSAPPPRPRTTTPQSDPSRPPAMTAMNTPPPQPKSFTAELLSGFDPTTRTGRRNLAGGLGSIAAGTMLGGPVGGVLGGVRAGATAALGAAAGGALAETGEQIVEGGPPKPGAIASAAGEQGAYDLAGGVISWPIKAIARRALAIPVARNAAQGLTTLRENVETQLRAGLDAAERTVGDIKVRTSKALEGVEQRLGMLRPAASPSQAGRMAHGVIEGPAKTARDVLGQEVEEAAKSGPPVNITELKAEAERILSTELRPPSVEFPRAAEVGDAGLPPINVENALAAAAASGRKGMGDELAAAMKAVTTEQESAIVKHPAMGVLTRILNAEDTVPFHAAHQFKRELDDAIGTNWDKAVKKRVTSITQHMRNTLRAGLSSHQPYNVATERYRAVAPLFTKGIAPQLKRQALENPESLVRLVKGNEPTKAAMLKDLLIDQAEAGGGKAQGQAAWDALRSAWTYEKVIKGGADKLGERIDKLDPEFIGVLYGDAAGKTVLQNLRQISQAFQTIVAKGAQDTDAAKAALQGVRRTKTAMKAPTPTEKAFKGSSVRMTTASLEQEGADIIRAVALGPTSIWGGLSIMRLLKGPKMNDLVQWAAYSPQRTQMLVQAVTSPAPGMAIADLMRAADLGTLAGDLTPTSDRSTPPPPVRAQGAGPGASAGPPRPSFLQ